MSLQTPPSLSTSGLPFGSNEPVPWKIQWAQEDTTDGTGHVLFSAALPPQVCFLQLQPSWVTEETPRPATRFPLWLPSSSSTHNLTVNTVNEALFRSSFPLSIPQTLASKMSPYYVGLFSLIFFFFLKRQPIITIWLNKPLLLVSGFILGMDFL